VSSYLCASVKSVVANSEEVETPDDTDFHR
jgi:hypothetical protein